MTDLEEIAIRDTAEQALIDIEEPDELEKHKFNVCAWMFLYIFGLALVATLIILTAYYLWK
jgi:hypothetical protein